METWDGSFVLSYLLVLVNTEQESNGKHRISLVTSLNTFESFRSKNYRYLWFGTYSAAFGGWLHQVSLGWFVFELTESPFIVAVVVAIRNVPFLFAGLGGGLAADRFNRKNLLGIMHVLISIWALLFSVTIWFEFAKWWIAAVYAFINGIMWSFCQPIRQSLVAAVVPKSLLANAIALQTVAFNVNMIIGPFIAGILITSLGIEASFFLQSIAYLGMSVFVWMIRLPSVVAVTNNPSSLKENLRSMFGYVLGNELLLALILLGLIFPLFVSSTVQLMPVYAVDVLNVDARGLGILLSSLGVGAVIGSLSLASLSNFSKKGISLVMVAILAGISMIALGNSNVLLISIVILLFMGIFNISGRVLIQTLLQLNTNDLFRGRILSLYVMQQGFVTVGTLLAGGLAQTLNVGIAMIIMGIMTVLVVLAVLAVFRSLISTR